jgi:NADPH:quinone reductase-like Zn-dependent oxidoreductase
MRRAASYLLGCLMVWHAAAHSAQLPQSMKAVSFDHFGDATVLRYGERPVPEVAATDILVRVRAASINPADWKSRQGQYARAALAAPIIPGFDIAGEVVAVGADVRTFRPGEPVYAMLPLNRSGGYAQFAVAPAANAAIKPRRLDYVHAAAVPLAALTAWQALDAANLQAGQTIVIQGGAGGVGHFAVQFARARGARVIATASAGNLRFLRQIGATEAIDYRAVQVADRIHDADVVLDTVGGDTLRSSYGLLKRGGYIASVVADPDAAELTGHAIRGSHVVVHTDGAQLAQISGLIDAGKVTPFVSVTLPLAKAAAAQDSSQSGHTRGKIVLRIP